MPPATGRPGPGSVTAHLGEDLVACRDAVAAVEAAAYAHDGHPSLGEHVWRDLEDPAHDSAGFWWDGSAGPTAAFLHVARSDTFAPSHWHLAVVAGPDARQVHGFAALLSCAVSHVARRGGGRAVLWRFAVGGDGAPCDGLDTALAAAGFEATRELHEMRVPLPLDERPRWPEGVTVRTFRPGVDEEPWLAVNNRAFANHPEQGGWIRATLARRMAEPWFDPELFLLAFDASGLAGFNWLKVHDAHGRDPRLGEIFVIGVDPRAHGTGLGRALAVEGLARVAARGIATGSLFVAADNVPARRLYDDLGFRVHRVDRAYERMVEVQRDGRA
jgi:mycothiol synthase